VTTASISTATVFSVSFILAVMVLGHTSELNEGFIVVACLLVQNSMLVDLLMNFREQNRMIKM